MPTIQINQKECFYQDVGQGYPLLFGHSFLWSCAMWEPQVKALSTQYRCIVPDLWDHGKSGHLQDNQTSMEALADHYLELMGKLGFEKFAIVGLSAGGMWGAKMTLKRPDAVQALVLMDTFVGEEPEATQRKYFAIMDCVEKGLGFSDAIIDQVAPIFFSPKTLTDKAHLVSYFRCQLADIPKDNIPGVVTLGRAIFSRPSCLEELSQIAIPSLVIVGNDDIPRPRKEAQEMVSRLPNGRLATVEDAGHICTLEQPDIVNKILSEFLQKNCQESR